MGRKYLIDTNVIIEYLGEVLPEKALTVLDGIIDRQFFISVINKIELLGFAGITESEEQKFMDQDSRCYNCCHRNGKSTHHCYTQCKRFYEY